MPEQKIRVDLTGVPETLLWNLHHRALEARRPDTVLADPKAVELADAIEYPFDRFGSSPLLAEGQALRARCFDLEVGRFLARHPDGTVVALGEGLETQFWRVDNGAVHWITVDLPETIEVRQRLLSSSDRQRTVAGSVLDWRWMDEVDPTRGVLVTAEGLLMYLEPADAREVITRSARRFPGSALVFDTVPRWFSAATMRGDMKTANGYQAPPMPWSIDCRELATLRSAPSIESIEYVRPPRGRGPVFGYVMPAIGLVPGLSYQTPWPSVFVARFRPA